MPFCREVWLILVVTGILVGTIIVGCDIFAFRLLEESRHAKRRQLRMDSNLAQTSRYDSTELAADSEDDLSDAGTDVTDATYGTDAMDGSDVANNDVKDVKAAGPVQEPKVPFYERWFVMNDIEYQEWRQRLRE